MLNFNLFESLNLSCFCKPRCAGDGDNEGRETHKKLKRDKYSIDMDGVYRIAREYKISVLPVGPDFELSNLYPLTNHVELWNVLVVGRDKTYILASIKDPHTKIPSNVLNRRGEESLPAELVKLFDIFWSRTLEGRQLQFFMVWNGKLYLVNTYPLRNGETTIIGAIMFMRAFSDEDRWEEVNAVRYSADLEAIEARKSSLEHPSSHPGPSPPGLVEARRSLDHPSPSKASTSQVPAG
jgi:hypothetical protein